MAILRLVVLQRAQRSALPPVAQSSLLALHNALPANVKPISKLLASGLARSRHKRVD